jgi:uncharacterized Zn-binding protein involved in type VI secretion
MGFKAIIMGQPAAKQGDRSVATDIHIVRVPARPSLVPTPLSHPFVGMIAGNLSGNINIMGKPAATVDSTADNTPAHIPTPPGTSFQKPPTNKATIKVGSPTVKINGKIAAHNGDIAETGNDPADRSSGQVIALSTVMIN